MKPPSRKSCYNFRVVEVVKIIDGDTADFILDLGFDLYKKERIRLGGINAPETRTRDLQEKEEGLKSKEWLSSKLTTTEPIKIRTEKEDKYGRILGWIFIGDDDISINNHMIEEGYAEQYIP